MEKLLTRQLLLFRFPSSTNLSQCNRQPEKRSEYQTLVLNNRPFGNALAVSFFRHCERLRLCAYDFHCSIQKRRSKLWRNVSINESHVLYSNCITNFDVNEQLYLLNMIIWNMWSFLDTSGLWLQFKSIIDPSNQSKNNQLTKQ